MTAVSVISILLLASLLIIYPLSLKGKGQHTALRATSVGGQLVCVMVVVVGLFLMAQESVIYNNQTTGLYDAEGIDLFYMSKAAGIVGICALLSSVLCFVLRLVMDKKGDRLNKWWVIILPPIALAADTAIALWWVTKNAPTEYYTTLVPAIFGVGWCLFVLAVNLSFAGEQLWRRFVIFGANLLNFIAVTVALLWVSLLASDVAIGLSEDLQSGMVVLLSFVLLVFAAPAVINLTVGIIDVVKMAKQLKSKGEA